MKSKLLQSYLKVYTFWWLVLFFSAENHPMDYVGRFLKGWAFALVMGAIGVLTVVLYFKVRHQEKVERIAGSELRGMRLTLGKMPVQEQLKRKTGYDVPDEFKSWMETFKSEHPKHYALLQAGIDIMHANPVQASPVKGGHGDVNLITHSFNVLREMIKAQPSYQYAGSKNKKGDVVVPLTDREYVFDPLDPVSPLAAFFHDLGKIVCYQPQKDGSTKEVKENHDIQGGKLIVNINEFWELSKADRDLLIMTISHYHHPIAMPLWCDDRTRAVTELLIKVDNEAGKKEGGIIYQSMSGYVTTGDDGDDEDGEAVQVSQDGKVTVTVTEHAAQQMFDALNRLIAQPNVINGNNKITRIGFKAGAYVYIQDQLMRTALSTALEDSTLTAQTHPGLVHPKTIALLNKLDQLGFLYRFHNNAEYSPQSALFNVECINPSDGRQLSAWKYTLVIKVEAFTSLAGMEDCPAPPVIVKNTWGETRAINKKKTKEAADAAAATEATAGNDVVVDAETMAIEAAPEVQVNMVSDATPSMSSMMMLDEADIADMMSEAEETSSIDQALLLSIMDEDDAPYVPPVAEVQPVAAEETPAPVQADAPAPTQAPTPVPNTPEVVAVQPEPTPVASVDDVQSSISEEGLELDIVSDAFLQSLRMGKVETDVAFKVIPYEHNGVETEFLMYPMPLLKDYYSQYDWDELLKRIRKGEVVDSIFKVKNKGMDSELYYLGFVRVKKVKKAEKAEA